MYGDASSGEDCRCAQEGQVQRAQQLYLQRRGEFVTAPLFAAGCATVTRQAKGIKAGQKARGRLADEAR
jgi:hypothetical protein